MLHNDLLRNLARYCVTLAFAMPLAANATGGTYLVGPDGVYATIQDAVNQAVTDGGGTIKIEQGFYFESVVIGLSNAATVLNISGSWNQYFSSNLSYLTSGTPTSIVTPDPGSNALYVNASAGELNIQDMAFAGAHLNNGFNGATGAVEIVGSGNGSVGIAASAIYNNKTDTSAPLRGAGLYALMSGHSQVYLTFTNIFGNHITGSTGTGDAQGAGAMFSLSDSAGASIDSSRISENTIDYPTGGCQGAGLYVATTAYASFFLDRSTVTHNSLGNCLRRNAAGGYFYADNTSNQAGYTLIDHARWIGNLTGASSGVDQVVLDAHNASLQYMSNNLVVGGDARGLWTNAVDGSTVIVLNDTIANNTSYGLEVAGNTQVYNSISWSNGANLLQGAGSTLSHCLTAADPLFVSVAANNYRLRSGSPAIDAGTNTLSTGQILQGGVDLDGLARIQGAAIDIGAYETGDDIFRDDFDAANY